MFFWAILFAVLSPIAHSFECMTVCRKPLWTCINKGIPGHEIAKLQQCVIKDIEDGMWDTETLCIECFESQIVKVETEWPTQSPTEMDTTDCTTERRKRNCEAHSHCMYREKTKDCVEVGFEGETPTPTKSEQILDDMQPCLTYCRDQAMDCAFTHGVDTTCVSCMRECVYMVSFDSSNRELFKPECGQCIADVFTVLGNPQQPPDSFALFSDYQKWMKTKGTEKSCVDDAGKWKQGDNKSRCVPPKKPKQLVCKKVKDLRLCTAIGCVLNEKKGRCAGTHKWKESKNNKKDKKGGR